MGGHPPSHVDVWGGLLTISACGYIRPGSPRPGSPAVSSRSQPRPYVSPDKGGKPRTDFEVFQVV